MITTDTMKKISLIQVVIYHTNGQYPTLPCKGNNNNVARVHQIMIVCGVLLLTIKSRNIIRQYNET